MTQTHEQKLLAKGWKRTSKGFVHPSYKGGTDLHNALYNQNQWELKAERMKAKTLAKAVPKKSSTLDTTMWRLPERIVYNPEEDF